MSKQEVFVGLGGNIGDVYFTFLQVFNSLSAISEIEELKQSKIYRTSPVSDLPQTPYLNAVCKFYTSLSAHELLKKLQQIQIDLGQFPKPKNAPRIIDLDILFFGEEMHNSSELEIPHPRWRDRLFVLIPLLDLAQTIKIPGMKAPVNLVEVVQNFKLAEESITPYFGEDDEKSTNKRFLCGRK